MGRGIGDIVENYYNNYLINSTSYVNLDVALEKLDTISQNVIELQNVFQNASGNNIELIKKDINDIQNNLEDYIKKINEAKEKLKANANKFDSVLNSWKMKIGENYSSPVEVLPRPLDSTFNVIEYRTKYEKIDSVSISSNGYINVKVKSYIENVEKNVLENKVTRTIENVNYNIYEHGFTSVDDYI